MNQLDERQVGQQVIILGWLHIVGSAFFFAIAAFVFALLSGIGIASRDPEAVAVLGVVATAIGIFLTLLAVPGIAAGIGLLMRRNWGRILAIVVSILNVINFPIGTIIAAYTLWVLLQTSAPAYFEHEHMPIRRHEGQITT